MRGRIPVDGDGNVPRWAIYSHMLDADRWSSTGKRRSVSADRAKAGPRIHAPQGEMWTPDELEANGWWDSVNGSDLMGVDDGTSDAFRTFGHMDAGLRSVFSRIAVIAPPDRQEEIVRIMDGSFTRSELELMAREGLVIELGPYDHRYRGTYMAGDHDVGTPVVLLDEDFDPGVLVHELIHHLRALQGREQYDPSIVAEAAVRTASPVTPPYYDTVGGSEAYARDLEVFAPKGRRLKGKRAIARAERMLPGTAISGFREDLP